MKRGLTKRSWSEPSPWSRLSTDRSTEELRSTVEIKRQAGVVGSPHPCWCWRWWCSGRRCRGEHLQTCPYQISNDVPLQVAQWLCGDSGSGRWFKASGGRGRLLVSLVGGSAVSSRSRGGKSGHAVRKDLTEAFSWLKFRWLPVIVFVVGRDIAVMHGEFVVSVFCSQFVDAGGLILSGLMMK